MRHSAICAIRSHRLHHAHACGANTGWTWEAGANTGRTGADGTDAGRTGAAGTNAGRATGAGSALLGRPGSGLAESSRRRLGGDISDGGMTSSWAIGGPAIVILAALTSAWLIIV